MKSTAIRFSIRALLYFTAIVALSANALLPWQRLANAKKEFEKIQIEINGLSFDEAYVESHTRACELAIANNPLPSPYYVAAKKRHDELSSLTQQYAK